MTRLRIALVLLLAATAAHAGWRRDCHRLAVRGHQAVAKGKRACIHAAATALDRHRCKVAAASAQMMIRDQVRLCRRTKGQSLTTTTSTTTSTSSTIASTPTTSSSTTTTAPPVCGNGVRERGEDCDGADFGGATCADNTPPTCTPTCTLGCLPTFHQLAFTNAPGTTDCGGAGIAHAPAPPLSGAIFSDVACTATVSDLGLGCLYIGGGGASIVPPGATPDGATAIYGIAADQTTLTASAGHGPGDCSQGAGPGAHCIGDTNTGAACTTDLECGGFPGSCGLDAHCYFAPPLPIENGAQSTCVVNVFQTDGSGTVDLAAGASSVTVPLSSRVYLTANSASPCPTCVNGACTYGPGTSCAIVGGNTLATTIDCPPPADKFLAPLTVTLGPLTSGTATATAADGNFCPRRPADAFGHPGAFGKPTATCIEEVGAPAGDLTTGSHSGAGVLASVFCIPATGNPVIDPAADLPGPGAFSITGTARAIP